MEERKSSKILARDLRRRQTKEEEILWAELRNRKFEGLKFLRQYPIYISETQGRKEFVIPDFYCVAQKLIIEIDGGYHTSIADIDKNRDNTLQALFGIRVLRITNEEMSDLKTVLNKIRNLIIHTD